MKSSQGNDLSRPALLLLALIAIAGQLYYLWLSNQKYRLGFPLDDSWIHLTYARNLALRGEWSFLPGQTSGGSTSPLWTLLLAPGFLLQLAPHVWPYLLGGLCFFLLAWRIEWTIRRLVPVYRLWFPCVGVFILAEWHFAWAASSGMEILLHALLIVIFFSLFLLGDRRYLLWGGIIGLGIWIRPDSLTLLGPAFAYILLQPDAPSQKLHHLLKLAAGFALLFIPYLLFNAWLSGTPWPNTFYAKQAEYADWQAEPFWVKGTQLIQQFVVGPAIFLLPAVILVAIRGARSRSWSVLLALVWFIGYTWLYTSRLPLYQYGRYIMPALPVYLLLGLFFLVEWAITHARTRALRRLRFGWLALLTGVTGILWFTRADAYASDVAWIESEMVQAARWAAANLPDDAVIAAHDIGALGYFDGRHPIVDLAGLISPEVIPVMLDESALKIHLRNQGVTHLIAFPPWYPAIAADCRPIYKADGPYIHLDPQGEMTVYDCRKP